MTAREVLDGIKDRLTKATPGPWGSVEDTYRSVPMLRIGSHVSRSDVAQVIMHAAQDKADAVFIAAAPVDMPRLTRAVESVLALADDPDQTLIRPKGDKTFYVEAHRIRAAIEDALSPKEGQ